MPFGQGESTAVSTHLAAISLSVGGFLLADTCAEPLVAAADAPKGGVAVPSERAAEGSPGDAAGVEPVVAATDVGEEGALVEEASSFADDSGRVRDMLDRLSLASLAILAILLAETTEDRVQRSRYERLKRRSCRRLWPSLCCRRFEFKWMDGSGWLSE